MRDWLRTLLSGYAAWKWGVEVALGQLQYL